jgi:signal peptidase I
MQAKGLSSDLISYAGPSMNPTLKVPDTLKIIPYHDPSEIEIGDVIIFKSPSKDINIVHRVVSISADGIRTRGDNNSKIDQFIIKFENISGKVISARKGKRDRVIWNGQAGQVYCLAIRGYHLIIRLLRKLGHLPYLLLARTHIFCKFLPVEKEAKVVMFTNSKQLIWNGRRIGIFMPRKGKWHIYPPYRLFINEDKLPC